MSQPLWQVHLPYEHACKFPVPKPQATAVMDIPCMDASEGIKC